MYPVHHVAEKDICTSYSSPLHPIWEENETCKKKKNNKKIVKGFDNILANFLSRISSISSNISLVELATLQCTDAEFRAWCDSQNTSLCLDDHPVPGSRFTVICDVSPSRSRPVITAPLRRATFLALHELAHPGIKATTSLVTDRYVWLGVKQDTHRSGLAPASRASIVRLANAPTFCSNLSVSLPGVYDTSM